MNNDEKAKYINEYCEATYELIELQYDSEKVYNEYVYHFSHLPKKLYRYVRFDKENHTIDSIENNYVYLGSAVDMDDVFESSTFCNYKNIEDLKELLISDKYHAYFVERLLKKYEMYEPYANLVFKKDGINDKYSAYYKAKYVYEDHRSSINDITNILGIHEPYIRKEGVMDKCCKIAEQLNSERNETGICAFTEDGANQVMWSMYADNFKGCVIEYDISPADLTTCFDLVPIVYTNDRKNDSLELAIDVLVNTHDKTVRDIDLEITKSKLMLSTRKSVEWSFQKEWRILGKKCVKAKSPVVTAIYLGKDISKRNKNKILKLANKKIFKVYEQTIDYSTNVIKYNEIIGVPKNISDKSEIYNSSITNSLASLTYDDYESYLLSYKIIPKLVTDINQCTPFCKADNFSFSFVEEFDNHYVTYDLKYWERTPIIEELQLVVDYLNKKKNHFDKDEKKIQKLIFIVAGKIFTIRTIKCNINAFIKHAENIEIRYFDSITLKEIDN